MRLWQQAVLAVGLIGGTVAGLALLVPGSRPMLARAGLGGVMDQLGLSAAEAAQPSGPQGGGQRGPAAQRVVAVAPTAQPLRSAVAAIGTARGVNAVAVAAEVTGRIRRMAVTSGQRVQAGDLLAELEDEAARIAVDRARVDFGQAQADYDRVARLRQTGAATDLQVQNAEVTRNQADLALREAEYLLSQHRITSPIQGWVGIVDTTPGRLVAAGDEIARIEDRTRLLVDFRVPERVVPILSDQVALVATPLSDGGQPLNGRLTAIDNRVDPTTRSLMVQAEIDNAEDRLRAGMAISITLEFTGDTVPAVDPLAIQWSGDGAFVWAVRDGRAVQLPIRILQREADAVLVEVDLAPGDLVVIEGVQTLRDGAEVALVEQQS